MATSVLLPPMITPEQLDDRDFCDTVLTIAAPPAPDPYAVKLATPEDEERLYLYLVQLHHDNPMPFGYEPAKVLATIRQATERQGAVIGIIEGDDGEIAASVGLYPWSTYYSDEFHYAELWLYVRPAYRGLGHDARLFDFMKHVQQTMQADLERPFYIQTAVTSVDRLPAKERLWRRHGPKVGAIFLMGFEPATTP